VTQHVRVSNAAALYAAGIEGQRKAFLVIPLKETAVKAEEWNATKGLLPTEGRYLVTTNAWFVILSQVGCYINLLVQLLGAEVTSTTQTMKRKSGYKLLFAVMSHVCHL
jgi:hypothetical protein